MTKDPRYPCVQEEKTTLRCIYTSPLVTGDFDFSSSFFFLFTFFFVFNKDTRKADTRERQEKEESGLVSSSTISASPHLCGHAEEMLRGLDCRRSYTHTSLPETRGISISEKRGILPICDRVYTRQRMHACPV